MKILFITLFPDFVKENFNYSILKRAVKTNLVELFYINPRDFTDDKHSTVDDYPFGGGNGMVLKAEPFVFSIMHAKHLLPDAKVIILSPDGQLFSQAKAKDFSKLQEIIFVCGHYEGFDERIKNYVDASICIGDYILTGGELAAMVIADAVCRLLPGVLGKIESTYHESFSDGLLEYPQYTRPQKAFFGDVPDVLVSGNHAKINLWRREKMLEKTYNNRPDLLDRVSLDKTDQKLLKKIIDERLDEKK